MATDEELLELLSEAHAFCEPWYVATNPEATMSGLAPIEQFVEIGQYEGASPHPLFDPAFYLERNRDVEQAGTSPIVHYLRYGGKEWRLPSPMIDGDRYYESYRSRVEATATGTILEDFARSDDRARALQFFDATYYAAQDAAAPAVYNRALEHFFCEGIMKGLSPHRLLASDCWSSQASLADRFARFSSLFTGLGRGSVIQTHPFVDVAFWQSQMGEGGPNPAVAYIRSWQYLEAWLHPLIDVQRYRAAAEIGVPGKDPMSLFLKERAEEGAPFNYLFDEDFYTDQFGHLFAEGQDAIGHYMQWGHLPWFQPSEGFGQRYYIRRYQPALSDRWPALAEYLHRGVGRGDAPLPPRPFLDTTRGMTQEEIAADIRAKASPRNEGAPVTVVIPCYENIDYTLRCVWSIVNAADATPVDILVVDDRSPDGSGHTLSALFDSVPTIHVKINDENLGFLRSCNAAVADCGTEFVFLLNNDTVVLDGYMDELVGTMERDPSIGLAGSKLLYPNGLLQEAGGIVWEGGAAANYGRLDDPSAPEFSFTRDVDYISGAAILIRRELWDAVGAFSDEFAPAYYEDTDLAMKVRRAGKRVVLQPLSRVVHFEGISSGTDLSSGIKQYQAINAEKFARSWEPELAAMGKAGDLSWDCVDRAVKGRILVIDAELPRPDKDSGSVTCFHMLRLLVEEGYRVTFLPSNLAYEGRYAIPLQRLGVQVIHAPYVFDPQSYISEHGGAYDLFIVSRAPVGRTFLSHIRSRFPGKKVVFDTVDIHHLRMLRQAELTGDQDLLESAFTMKRDELAMLTAADASLLVSSFEVDYLEEEIGPFPHMVLPLIYEPYQRVMGYAERKDIAFVGNFRHPPNMDSVKYLVEDVWPLVRKSGIDATLKLVGSYPPPELSDYAANDISVVGFVEDLEGFLETVRLTVAPLRFGAGVKGKVGNSLRMGVPVVGTPIATEGMGLVDGEHVLTARNTAELAAEIVRAYTDAELWERLSRNGQDYVLSSFGIEAAREKLVRLVNGLVS